MAIACCRSNAQEPATTPEEAQRSSLSDKLWLSGQVNIVTQFHASFPAQYSGPDSLSDGAEEATTGVATLYTGYGFTKYTEGFFDLESSRGAGVSGALGLGGLGDLDAVTDHTATAVPYIARAHIRQIIPLGSKQTGVTRSPLGIATSLPEKRLELRLGKMSVTDFFDLNSVGSDSHLQFLNYSIDNNAAFDIAANSRGYTYAALAELYQPKWAARFALALEPTGNSGHKTAWNVTKDRSENFEFEYHPDFIHKRSTILRALTFINHAQMASYADALSAYFSGQDPKPDLSAHLKPGQMDYGFGLNGEQEVNDWLRIFGRAGLLEGNKEAFQFAEADSTAAFGGDLDGKMWKRHGHHAGVAMAVNGLSKLHREYLELGGTSYLLGDGGLQYAHEKVIEAYYNIPLLHGIYASFDVQHIWDPGYNASRGPVLIFGVRLHLEGDIHFN